MNLFFDIETLPSSEMPSLLEIEAPKNYKDEKKILAYKEEKQEEEYRRQALNSLKGRLLCIGYAINDKPADCIMIQPENPNEKEMLVTLDNLVKNKEPVWIGYNIKGFDLLWLGHRAIKYQLPNLWHSLPKRRYDKNYIDVSEIFAMTDFKSYFSLKNVAKFLGIEAKSELSGDKVYDAWLNQEYSKIEKYCKQDVEVTREIYNKTKISQQMDEMPL